MKKTIDIIAALLLVIGGLNWGLVGLFGFDLVGYLFMSMPVIAKVIYILVGLSAIYAIVYLVRHKGHHCTDK
jgi:uncharacterized membrane protein YuzA (DUF378 family)